MLFKVKGELLSGNCEASMTSELSESDLELQSKDNIIFKVLMRPLLFL